MVAVTVGEGVGEVDARAGEVEVVRGRAVLDDDARCGALCIATRAPSSSNSDPRDSGSECSSVWKIVPTG